MIEVKNPIVSVVVATYRRNSSLENALSSLLCQTYKQIEIIVVDDNADKVWNNQVENIVKSFNDERVVLVTNLTNQGSAKTRNIGILEAKGDYVTFLDDDDVYLETKIENQLFHMIQHKSDFSITNLSLYLESGKLLEIRKRDYIKKTDNTTLLKYHLMHHLTGTDTMMFKKKYLLDINLFPLIDIGDEFYLMYNAIQYGGKFSYFDISEVRALVHVESEGLSSGNNKIKGENDLYDFKKNQFYKLDSRTIRYINMRHYAVLAFAELRRRNFLKALVYTVRSLFSSPLNCIKLFIYRK